MGTNPLLAKFRQNPRLYHCANFHKWSSNYTVAKPPHARVLHEKQVPFKFNNIDLMNGEQKDADYRQKQLFAAFRASPLSRAHQVG